MRCELILVILIGTHTLASIGDCAILPLADKKFSHMLKKQPVNSMWQWFIEPFGSYFWFAKAPVLRHADCLLQDKDLHI